jgi:hypothetical protein
LCGLSTYIKIFSYAGNVRMFFKPRGCRTMIFFWREILGNSQVDNNSQLRAPKKIFCENFASS